MGEYWKNFYPYKTVGIILYPDCIHCLGDGCHDLKPGSHDS